MKDTTFEDYLETVCFEANPSVLDDDMPDFFDNWLGSQDVEDMIRHCNNFLVTKLQQAKAEERAILRGEINEVLDIAKGKLYPYQDDTERLEIVIERLTSSLDTKQNK